MDKLMNSWHVGVAAEAFAAGMFARCGYDVSVQYGANQPEYDLIVAKADKILKVSVKGSQDGSWGLTQSYKNKDNNYHQAADIWYGKHNLKTIFCLVQFKNSNIDELPRIYLATPLEILNMLKATAKGRGDTILYENHAWGPTAYGAGTIDKIPNDWKFSVSRVEALLNSL